MLLNNLAAHTPRKTNSLAFYGSACGFPNLKRLWVVSEVDADLFKDGIRVPLDDGEILFAQHLEKGDLTSNVGNRDG
jgi:hypothetical protein